ncbi:MAG: 1-acyl-sn-glycerol-3-phosphate acyltransferase, partial [Pseudomonadales bacterium]|nr:1-acyl-sn-glycerol-3-phosphate acyltransferase [Pseudomonadales bacterium]
AIIKFLIKRELVWVPVVGWICLALNFPRLNRGRDPEARERDYQAVAEATTGLGEKAVALLNFAEGTRFTPEKHRAQASPWQHLLKPKAGGLRIMLENTRQAEIMDITLAYPTPGFTFWRCLSGELPYVRVHIDYCTAVDVEDSTTWLNERWRIKDQRIDAEFRKNER